VAAGKCNPAGLDVRPNQVMIDQPYAFIGSNRVEDLRGALYL
jgi:hypothetical protein